jgi:hypothetical protein
VNPTDDLVLRALAFDGRDMDGWDDDASGDGGDGHEPDPPMADTPMWLSHHWPGQYDRCAVIGGMHICRRCLVLYPLALVTGIAVSIGDWWPHGIDPWVLWLGPLPGTIEFVLDNLALVPYRPVRQMVLSAGGAVAAGVGYTRYLDHTTDTLVWSVVGVYTAVCLAAAIAAGLGLGRGGKRDRHSGSGGSSGSAGTAAAT